MSGVIELYDYPMSSPLRSIVYVMDKVPIYYDTLMTALLTGNYDSLSRWFPGNRRDVAIIDDATTDERKARYASRAQHFGLRLSIDTLMQQPSALKLIFRVDDMDRMVEMMRSMDITPVAKLSQAREYLMNVISARLR